MYDLFTAGFKADPFATFAAMRQHHPVYAHEAPDGATIWYITRYDDVLAVLKDHERFVKNVHNARPSRRAPGAASAPSLQRAINENMLFSDPPDHTRLRLLVNQAFTPRRVEQMRAQIQRIADELLHNAVAATPASFDLISTYALPLPVIVICDMLGIPTADQAQVTEWAQAIISPGSRGLSYRERRRRLRAFLVYLHTLFDARRRAPRDDLTTALVQAEQDGDRLNEQELSSMVALLIVTGHETTVNLIGNGALALLQHPQQLAWLRTRPEAWETAVEELLRYDGPVETSTTRWVAADVELHGRCLKRGDVVRVVLASANRDEDHFTCPDQLDVQRSENRHLAFGHGIHYCLGASLARLEGQIALRTLFTRFPELQLAVPAANLRWRSGVLFRGLEALPLQTHP